MGSTPEAPSPSLGVAAFTGFTTRFESAQGSALHTPPPLKFKSGKRDGDALVTQLKPLDRVSSGLTIQFRASWPVRALYCLSIIVLTKDRLASR